LSQNIEILLISEIHFTNKSYFHIPGYTLYHNGVWWQNPWKNCFYHKKQHYKIGKYQKGSYRLLVEDWNDYIIQHFSISAVYSLLKKCEIFNEKSKSKESYGLRIHNQVLQKLPEMAVIFITILVILRRVFLPLQWKVAQIIMI